MEDVNALLIKENILRSRLDKFIENGRKTPTLKRTQGFYESRITDLKNLWEEYCEIDLAISQELLQSNKGDCDYLKENKFGKADAKYSEYIGELVEGLRKFAVPTEQNNANAAPVHNTTVIHQESSLPKITIPKYNGDYDRWRSFHDLYVSLVHTNPKLTAVQKLFHLKSCLIGDAEKFLRHTPITDADYEPAWTKLKEKYENKRILVNHQLKVLVNQPKLQVEKNKDIKALLETTSECMQQLKSLNVDTSSWDALLVYLLVQKLPFLTLKLWEEEQGTSSELPTYVKFNEFLQKRLKILEAIADAVTSGPKHSKPNIREDTRAHLSIEGNSCPACQGKHFIVRCKIFNQLKAKERLNLIKTSGRCINCFSNKHFASKCTNKQRCFKCNQKHHTALHDVTYNEGGSKHTSSKHGQLQENKNVVEQHPKNMENVSTGSKCDTVKSNEEVSTTQAFVSRKDHQTLLSTALVIVQNEDGEQQTLRCLLDTGSQSSFITEETCKKLRATVMATSTRVTGLNASHAAFTSRKTTLTLRSCGSNKSSVSEDFLIIPQVTEALPTRTVSKAECKHLQGLELADPKFWKPGRIDALLGAQTFAKIVLEGVRRGPVTAPVALKTIFGWVLMGSTSTQCTNKTAVFIINTHDERLETQLKRFWEIEEIPSKKIFTKEEIDCQNSYESSVQRLENGTYQVKLPFINNQNPTIGQSRFQAVQRFMHLERKLAANPDLNEEYRKCLDEYLELDHMEAVQPPNEGELHYYIPHHAVIKESTTTKLRVVFDASAKTTNGTSLNNYLSKGPTLQPKLFATLLNWRKYKVALTADIEKMYRMISVHPDHRTFQRIIWQHPNSKEIQDFQLKTVTFGTSAAPYLAIKTLQQLAKDEEKTWPMASKAVFNAFYVDDVLTGADNIEQAKLLQNELINMMKAGGFNLRKWSSNEPELLANLPTESKEPRSDRFFSEAESMKALGVRWHPASDQFSFQINTMSSGAPITKRTILSEIATLYDPLGWLAPILITGKLLMQSLWLTGNSWDQPVSEMVQSQWTEFKQDLHNIKAIKIPRWVHYSSRNRIQLHGFCDASERAYAAAIYMRVQNANGDVKCHLLTAKTRVAPTKPITIPRLELNGAVLLARLIQTTLVDMQLQEIPIFAWTDSTIVLQWIQEHPSRWKNYVANRVVEIQDIIKYENWRHVPTKTNPADMASRGILASQLLKNDLWWNGPEWLVKDEESWPKLQKNLLQTTHEAKIAKSITCTAVVSNNLLTRYSSFNKLLRIIATMKRFIYNCKNSATCMHEPLNCTELKAAEYTILRLVQEEIYSEELKCLTKNMPIPRQSKILKLNPFLDNNELLRVGGRLENAAISYEQKHPIIVPQKHHVTLLLIDKVHKDTLHGGTSLVLNVSRSKYWIINARRCIGNRVNRCMACARQKAAINTQLMGNLPSARVNITKPFSKVGIDYAGPVTLKSSTLRNAKQQKAYICIFVCMATKAVHIELVSDLTSSAFVATLKRFVARRGLCTDIYSDCGTNFVGGNSMLQREFQQIIRDPQSSYMQHVTTCGINWHFNPPASPHFGGLWEAGVKSIKYHLRRVIGNAICTFEEYTTLLTQIEACLNSRPLCYIHNNPDDLLVLTPGHFLIGQPLMTIPEQTLSSSIVPPSQRWKYLQLLTQQFWEKWSMDYLNQLQNIPKWQTTQPNIQPGDLVLLKSENMHPTIWPFGIVERTFEGKDGLVRVVQLRTKNGSVQRPIAKLCSLPLYRF